MIKAALLLLTFACALTSCASGPSIEPTGQMPDDFALAVSVLAEPVDPSQTDVTRRPSRYVVLPDGTLRYGPDPIGVPGRVWLPPITRTLSRDQMMELWSLMQQVGLVDDSSGFEGINLKLTLPPDDEIVYAISLTAGERRRDVVRRTPIEAEPDPAIAHVIEHLARLAWVDERPIPQQRPMPKRYDFGPDPYEQYRNQESAK